MYQTCVSLKVGCRQLYQAPLENDLPMVVVKSCLASEADVIMSLAVEECNIFEMQVLPTDRWCEKKLGGAPIQCPKNAPRSIVRKLRAMSN